MPERTTTKFLNVDLDLFYRSEPTELLRATKRRTLVVNLANHFATLELWPQPRTAEGAILRFARVVDGLPPSARAQWNCCKKRVLNIGVEAGVEPYQAVFTLPKRALARAVEIRAEIVITVYACGARG